jgi:PAS domain S-box-containing protein
LTLTAPASLRTYAVATVSVACALAVLGLMEASWRASTPVAVFLVAVVLSAWVSGARAAACALTLSLLSYVVFYRALDEPISTGTHLVRLASLGIVAGYVVWLAATNRANLQSLRGASEELRVAIDTIPTMAWSVLPDGRIDFINRRWLDYSGLTLEEGVRDSLSTIHPDDRVAAMELWGKRVADGEPFEQEMRIRRADGQYFWFLVRTVPLRDAQGRIAKWYGTSTEIEELKRAQSAVHDKQQLLQSMLETLPVGVSVTDERGDIVLTNAAYRRIWGGAIFERAARMERSRGFWHHSGRAVAPVEWASAHALWQGKTMLAQLIDIETFEGGRKTIQNSAAPIRNADGAIIGAVVVNEDVTARVSAEKALRESAERLQHLSRRLFAVQEEERRHLARELHDEFGQLLTAISLHLQVAKNSPQPSASASLDECAALVARAGERVRGLALELRPTMLESAGLDGTLRWLAELHSRQGKIEVSVSGRVSALPNDVAITGFRVVQEALTNVLRHSGAQHVRIELAQLDGSLRISVEDDGAGFDVAATRAQAAARGHLGLIGMKERVDILRGDLEIASTVGSGTRVSASVPL